MTTLPTHFIIRLYGYMRLCDLFVLKGVALLKILDLVHFFNLFLSLYLSN